MEAFIFCQTGGRTIQRKELLSELMSLFVTMDNNFVTMDNNFVTIGQPFYDNGNLFVTMEIIL